MQMKLYHFLIQYYVTVFYYQAKESQEMYLDFLLFLDRHPMAVSWFHPGRFVAFFGEAISLFFEISINTEGAGAVFKRD